MVRYLLSYNMAIPTGKAWIKQIFAANAARTGGIVRRRVTNVQKFASYPMLRDEVKKRGFHMVRVGPKETGQYVIFCNQGEMKMLC